MTRKIFFLAGSALAVIAFSSIVSPAAARDEQRPYQRGEITPLSGVYVGGFGGYNWTSADVEGGPSLDLDGGDYGIFAGYQIDALLDRTLGMGINGAIEAHYAWSDSEDSETVAGVPFSAEKDSEWGVSFRPGLSFVHDVMPLGIKPYGIVGYRRAEFETTTAGVSSDEMHDGFELGIGTQLIAYDDVGVRLDYSHVWYEDKNGLDPDEDDLRLGVSYHF
jgi:opacity protein-like surface antigen